YWPFGYGTALARYCLDRLGMHVERCLTFHTETQNAIGGGGAKVDSLATAMAPLAPLKVQDIHAGCKAPHTRIVRKKQLKAIFDTVPATVAFIARAIDIADRLGWLRLFHH